jgi:cobalt-zinc-cadmium efflux system protein
MGLFHKHSHSHHHHHDHDDHHGHTHDRASHSHGASRSLKLALAVTLVFMVVELLGGFYANSLALISDGVHMAMDAGALGVSLFVVWLASRPARGGYTYGFQRAEVLGALLNGLTIWLISGFLVFESFERFKAPPSIRADWVIGVGVVGLLANLASLKFLHVSQKSSLNVRSAYIHVLTDCLGSVAAVVSGIVIEYTGWSIVDPILTCVFSVLMLWGSWRLVWESIEVLMERSPQDVNLNAIENSLAEIEGVSGLHDLHVWTLSSGTVALSVHLKKILSDASVTEGQILVRASEMLSKKFGITHSTIQIESDPNADCGDCGSDSHD